MGFPTKACLAVCLVTAGLWVPALDGPAGMLLVGGGLLLAAAQGRRTRAGGVRP